MFTVVIAQKEHIDVINEFSMFLSPLMDEKKFCFCEWNEEALSIEQALPTLYKQVGNKGEWRAIIVSDNGGLHYKNPFDRVNFQEPEEMDNVPVEQQLRIKREAKVKAYEQAAQNPLARLSAWLTERTHYAFDDEESLRNYQNDIYYADYVECQKKKTDLIDEMTDGEELLISYPKQIYTIALRDLGDEYYDIKTSWKEHHECQYSKFYDYNLYSDKLKFLIFDVIEDDKINYRFDYIKFIYTVLVLAGNDIPSDAIRPGRVYQIHCNSDEKALSYALQKYDTKLKLTYDELEFRIQSIQNKEYRRMTDREAEEKFLCEHSVELKHNESFRQNEFFPSHKDVGLARDCPGEEMNSWIQKFKLSKKALTRYLKEPRRSLKVAAEEMKGENEIRTDEIFGLNEFQLEDLKEFSDKEEKEMISTFTTNIHDTEPYHRRLEKDSENIKRVIRTRMLRATTLILAAVTIVASLFSFVPLLFKTQKVKQANETVGLMALCVVVLLAIILFICLFFLRHKLVSAYRRYNNTMRSIRIEIQAAMDRFSLYLTHACSLMRCNSAIKRLANDENQDSKTCKIFRRHQNDILKIINEEVQVFNKIIKEYEFELGDVQPYDYDFNRVAGYQYEMPLNYLHHKRITYIQEGSMVDLPVDFITSIIVEREELYE